MLKTQTKKRIFTYSVYFFAVIGLIFSSVLIGMQFGIFNVRGNIEERNSFFTNATSSVSSTAKADEPDCINKKEVCHWNETRQWTVVAAGLSKDAAIIEKVSGETGVPARVLAAAVMPEQLRFFSAEREVFKKYFEPLKILGSMSKFSLGVSGIKPDTAKKIEEYANATSSPFYPGEIYAPLLAYSGEASDNARYNRLTDAKDHYYSYLYTAIYIKEIESQWRNSGVDTSKNPGVVATLFNLGFTKSIPNANPKVGGAEIELGGTTYTYGELAGSFYNSKELNNF